MKQYIDDYCDVTCVDTGVTVTADILDFKQGKTLSVSVNKSVKMIMPFNGKVYEGKISGLTFTSNGPKVTDVTVGR